MKPIINKDKKWNSGISMIALIITIIVLLILASIGIGALTGENGIITQSRETKELKYRAGVEEELNYIFTKPTLSLDLQTARAFINEEKEKSGSKIVDFATQPHNETEYEDEAGLYSKDFSIYVKWADKGHTNWVRLEEEDGFFKVDEILGEENPPDYSSMQCKISFKKVKDEASNPETYIRNFSSKLGTLPLITFKGYRFEGWYTSKDGGEKITEDTLTPEKNEVEYFAHWKAITLEEMNIKLDKVEFVYKENVPQKPVVTIDYKLDDSSEPIELIQDEDFTVTYKDIEDGDNLTDVGEKKVIIKGIGDNYGEAGEVVKYYKIVKAESQAPNVKAKELIYTGSEQVLLTVSGNKGQMHYKLDNGSWGTEIPKATNAGDYKVYWYMDESSNYQGLASKAEPNVENVTIGKKTQNPTVKENSLTYTGSAQELITTSGAQGTMHYKVESGSWGTAIPKGTNAGTYTVYWYMDESLNYNGIGSETNPNEINVTIAKKTENPTVTAKSLTYTGNAQALVTTSGAQGTMHYKLDDGAWETTIPSAINAGTYTVSYYMDASTNYNAVGSSSSPKTVSVTIAKKTQNPTVTAKSLTYTGSAQALVTVSGNQGTMHYKLNSGSWGTSIPTATNAGSYTVSYYMDATTNYNAVGSSSSPKTVSVTIAKKTQNPTVTGKTVTYNAAGQALATVSGAQGTMHYKLNSGSWGTSIPTATNPGSYTVYWYMDASSNYNAVGTQSSPKSASAKINDLTYTVTFNGNGGSGTTRTVRYKATVGTLPSSSRKGYTFDGWYTAASGGTKITTSYQVTKAVTFYAHWKIITYTVSLTTNWATNVGTIITSFGGQGSHIGGANAYYRASSATYSKVNLTAGHTYAFKGGPYAPGGVTPVNYTISVGNISHSGVTSSGPFQQVNKVTTTQNSVTPTIKINSGGYYGSVYYDEFNISYATLYDITSLINAGYSVNSRGDYYTRTYTVETATFTIPYLYQTGSNGKPRKLKWNTGATDNSIPKGTTGNKAFVPGE